MRKFIFSMMLLIICVSTTATIYAATPQKSYMEIKDGRHVITKTFEASPEEDPTSLVEKPFEQDGFSYSYYETSKDEVPITETRKETQPATARTDSNDAQAIIQKFAPDIDYSGDDGFTGKLFLDNTSVKTEVEGYTTKTYTLTDTAIIMGLGSNDTSAVPKTTSKSGVTLNLQNVDWSPQETGSVDFTSVTTMYKAVAHYSGSYSKKVPTGYISTADYTGDVTKTHIDKVIYTLTYIGTEIPKPAPSPTPDPTPTPSPEPEKDTGALPFGWIAGIAVCLAIIGGGITAFLLLFHNTLIYLKNADEYSLIAKRRLNWNNPVVDLNGLNVARKEVAVNVKKQLASKLFGRHIKTVFGDFSIRCLVDKQDGDFWYVVDIPAGISAESPANAPEKDEDAEQTTAAE